MPRRRPVPVPPGKMDPVRQVFALNFSQHLRDMHHFTEAGQAWEDYLSAEETENPRDKKADMAKASLRRAATRLDVVTMLLERRLLHG